MHAWIIGVSLNKSATLIMATPCTWNNGMYLRIIYLTLIALWFPRSMYALKCCRYIDMVHVQQQVSELLVSAAMKIVNEDRQVN